MKLTDPRLRLLLILLVLLPLLLTGCRTIHSIVEKREEIVTELQQWLPDEFEMKVVNGFGIK